MFVLRAHGIGDTVAQGFYVRVQLHCQNRELATPCGEKPPTHATISSDDDGISTPIRKSPPHATSAPPAPHPTTHSSPSTLPTRCLLRSSEGNSDGATDDDGNGDGATHNYDANDDDGNDSNGVVADDDVSVDVNNDNVNNNNLLPRVGKRNDGCNETKTRRRRC